MVNLHLLYEQNMRASVPEDDELGQAAAPPTRVAGRVRDRVSDS